MTLQHLIDSQNCPVTAIHDAGAVAANDAVDDLLSVMRRATPKSLAGACHLLVALDIDLDDLSVDHTAMSSREIKRIIDDMQEMLRRALAVIEAEARLRG